MGIHSLDLILATWIMDYEIYSLNITRLYWNIPLLLVQVSYLLEGNPDRMNFRVKDTGMTPLHAAVKSGSVATLKVS
jgi:hypothetical protein